jgi:hypothetical protein
MADTMTDPNETANVAAGPMPGATGDCATCEGMGLVQDPMYGPTPCDQCNATGRALAADETASLAGQLIQGYREHLAEEAGPEIIAVPGRVLGGDIEGQADALADDAARLAELLAGFSQEPRRSMDAIAVFRGLSRAAESMAAAAAELRRQEWFDLGDDAEPEAIATWNGALEGLKSAASTLGWVADGWI